MPSDHSWKINFQIKHAFKTVTGSLNLKSKPDLNNHLSATNTGYELTQPIIISFSAIDLNTGNTNRDSHMLETLQYPDHKKITLKIDSISRLPNKNHYLISGKITIATKTRAFSTTTILVNNKARGNFFLKLTEFGLKPPSLLFMSIEDQIKIEYSVAIPKTLNKNKNQTTENPA